MAPLFRFITSSGSKKKEPKFVCLSEAKALHSHRTWTEVSSSVPHFLQVGLLLNPIIYRCLRRMLCLVRMPVMTLDCVLLKDSNRTFVAMSTTRTMPPCQMLVIHPAVNLIIDILPRDPKGRLRSYKLLHGAALASFLVRWVKKLFPHLLDLSIPNGCILLPSSSHRDLCPHIMKSCIVEALSLGCNYPLATERQSYAGTGVHCSANKTRFRSAGFVWGIYSWTTYRSVKCEVGWCISRFKGSDQVLFPFCEEQTMTGTSCVPRVHIYGNGTREIKIILP